MKNRFIIPIILFACVMVSCSNYADYEPTINNEKDTLINTIDTLSSQNYMVTACAENNEGYYFIDIFEPTEYKKIYFWNIANEECIPWCNKINCYHNNSECTAILPPDEFSQAFVFYQDQKLYLISRYDDGDYLEQFDKDGSNRKKLCKLYNTNNYFPDRPSPQWSWIILHQGYAYYGVTNDYRHTEIYSIKLEENSKPTFLFDLDYNENIVVHLRADRHKLYLMVERTELIDLYEYDILNEQISVIEQDAVIPVFDANANYFYYSVRFIGVIQYNIDTGEKNVFSDEYTQYIGCNENYVITIPIIDEGIVSEIRNKGYISIMTHDGEEIRRIEIGEYDHIYIAGSRHLLVLFEPPYTGLDLEIEGNSSVYALYDIEKDTWQRVK